MSQSRQLAAIMFTDIVGYTKLMGNDQAKAIESLRKNRELQKPIVENFHGNWIKELGDGVMASFNTVSDAVNAAIKIQEACNELNEFQLRIGIHQGEMVFENEDVFGDGVNVASRIVSMAVPGGIYISGKVFDEIKNQKNIECISLGMYELKNVNGAVEIYAISNPGISFPQNEKPRKKNMGVTSKKSVLNKTLLKSGIILIALIVAAGLYIKFSPAISNNAEAKSIAVLPFINLSSDKDDEYFAVGMCDEILTNLSKIGDLKVISHTSVLKYKNTNKSLREIAGELGVNNILEGSVQKSKDRIRINVQLINAKNDQHLWAESYDRDNKDVFSIQSEIAKMIAQQMNATLSEKEKSLIEEKPTENLQAYDFYLRGKNYYDSYLNYANKDTEGRARVERMFRAALRLDPHFVEAYFGLINSYLDIYWNGVETNSDDYKIKAKNLLDSLLLLNIDKPAVHMANGYYKYHGERDYKGAIEEFDIVEKSNPNNSDVIIAKGYVYRRLGKFDEAIKNFEKAAALNPNSKEAFGSLSTTLIQNRNADAGILATEKSISLEPDLADGYLQKAQVYIDFKNDFKTARAVLDNARNFVDVSKLNYLYEYMDALQGNYTSLLKDISRFPDSLSVTQANIFTNAKVMAVIFKAEGKPDSAKKYFNRDRELMTSLLKKEPDDFRIHANLGVDYAGLGEKKKALEHANRACQLMPLSKDGLMGVFPLEGLALVYTYLEEQNEAIDILEKLLKLPKHFESTTTIPLYKLHPNWKSLQNNPRFQKMLKGENG